MAEAARSDLKGFLVKVGAVTLAALVVLYAASAWLRPQSSPTPDDEPPAEAISWQQAARHVGKYCTVEGRIVETHRVEKAIFLNFHPDWRSTFTAVIFASRFDAFPTAPEEHYRGKNVRVTGLIRDYEGKPEIVLASPDQIEVID